MKPNLEQVHSFDTEFQDIQCLLISEVRVLLEVAKDRKLKESGLVQEYHEITQCDAQNH